MLPFQIKICPVVIFTRATLGSSLVIYMPAPSPYLKVECVKVVEFLECKYSGESEKEIKC